MKLDILAFGAHPDDVELSCSGTLYKFKKQGKRIGIIDLTKGELGTRGNENTRKDEAERAAKILDLDARENLDLGDGFFEVSKENKLRIVQMLRKYRPEIVLANAVKDRHTDHGRGAELVKESIFISGLTKVETELNGEKQEPWRPKHLFNYIQFQYISPQFIIDITNEWAVKEKSILAYETQFYNPSSDEPKTLISSEMFLKLLEARAREFGAAIEVNYGEGFTTDKPLPYDFLSLL